MSTSPTATIATMRSTPLLGVLLVAGSLVAGVSAQEPSVDTAAAARTEKRAQRLLQDLKKAAAKVAKSPHAYQGRVGVYSHNEPNRMVPLEHDFRGARNGNRSWFALDRWQVAHHGKHTIVRRLPERTPGAILADQLPPAWQEPQGDSPEVPLTPALLLPHFQHATLGTPKPTEYQGRPAMQVHASWTGKPAKNVVYAATVPSSQHEQTIEALAGAAGRNQQHFQTDAILLYDPASKAWLSSTLRFVYLDGRKISADEQAPKAPAGMPLLTIHPAIEAIWHIERCPTKDVPMPTLDQAARQRLRLPEATKPKSLTRPGSPKDK